MTRKYNSHTVPIKKGTSGHNMSVLILAGTYGYRMRSYGPKCLQKLSSGPTILQQQIDNISMVFPKAELVLVCGHDADKVIKSTPPNVRIVENQVLEANEVEELRLGLNNITTESVLILSGDLIFNVDTIRDITKSPCLVVDTKGNMPEDCVGATVLNNTISILDYGLNTKWCHILMLHTKELSLMKEFVSNRDRNRMFMHEAINKLIENGCVFKSVESKKQHVLKIDSVKYLSLLEDI